MSAGSVPVLKIAHFRGTSRGGWRLTLLVVAVAVLGSTGGGASLVQYVEPALVLGIAGWLLTKRRPTDYAEFILLLWFISPELRRYADYHSAYHSESAILVAPYVAAMFGPLVSSRGVRPSGLLITEFTYLAIVIVLYAGVVGLMLGTSKTAVLADLLTWLPPVVFAVFLLSGSVDRGEFERMITRVARWLLLTFAVYGIVQWILAPPWDGAWLQDIGSAGSSFGVAKAFGLRIWGFANSPGTYAGFLGWLLVIVGARVATVPGDRWLKAVALLLGTVALGITGVRAAWIAVLVSLLVLMWYGRVRATRLIASVAVLALVIGSVGPLRSLVVTRFDSIAQGTSGQSANARLSFQSDALPAALRDPVGQGLGSTGAGVRAGEAQSNNPYANTDSGYVQVLREFGSLPGGCLLLLLTLICVASALDGYSQDRDGATWAAINATVPISLVFGAVWGITVFIALGAAAMGRSDLLRVRQAREALPQSGGTKP